MTPDKISELFTRSGDGYVFARWGRPIVPVVFGVEEATLEVLKGAIEAVVTLAGHQMAETDPELGANLMIFFIRNWDELAETPNMDRLLPDLKDLIGRLKTTSATNYRAFRFDDDGAIQACFVFVRMDETISEMPAETIALGEMVQAILLWSERAFSKRSPLAIAPAGETILRPDIAAVIRASYDPVMPAATNDAGHALRLSARIGTAQ